MVTPADTPQRRDRIRTAHLSCCVTINSVVGIGKGSSPGSTPSFGIKEHQGTSLRPAGGCHREWRYCECLGTGAGRIRVKALLQSGEYSVPTKRVPRKLKQSVIPKREMGRGKGW